MSEHAVQEHAAKFNADANINSMSAKLKGVLRRKSTMAFLLCLPLIVLVLGLIVYPFFYSIWLAMLNKKETTFVKENLMRLDYLETNRDFYVYCGELGNQLRKAGISAPFTDLVIAAHAKRHNLCIFSQDNHFESISLKLGIQFEILKNF